MLDIMRSHLYDVDVRALQPPQSGRLLGQVPILGGRGGDLERGHEPGSDGRRVAAVVVAAASGGGGGGHGQHLEHCARHTAPYRLGWVALGGVVLAHRHLIGPPVLLECRQGGGGGGRDRHSGGHGADGLGGVVANGDQVGDTGDTNTEEEQLAKGRTGRTNCGTFIRSQKQYGRFFSMRAARRDTSYDDYFSLIFLVYIDED